MATLRAMFKLFDGYSTTIDKISRGTDNATSKIINASRGTDDFNRKLESTGASAGIAISGVSKLESGLKRLLGAIISVTALIKGMSITDEYTNTSARLDLINDGLQTQVQLQDKIFAAADRSKGVYTDMAAAVSKMGLLAGDAFTSNDELIAFTELVQKGFKVGGADTSEQMGAMRQLTQAMASGRLQGDELVSIMENAPMMYEAIAKYTGKSKGELKEMGSQGKITADIIKNSMFMASDDINTKFETLPMTFADTWNKIKNSATRAFSGSMGKANRIINSEKFNTMINGVMNGLSAIANIALDVLDIISRVGSFFVDNWSIIEPIIWGIVGAMVVYKLITLQTVAAKAAHTVASWLETAAILAMIVAQDGLNAALAACPLTWIITGVIILATLFYIAIGAVNKFTKMTISATGAIIGTVSVAAAFVGNTIIGLVNAMIQGIWLLFVEPFIGIIEWVLNVANGGFNSFGDAVANLIGQIIGWFMSLGKVVTTIIDAIFGTDWTSGLSSLQRDVLSWGKNEKTITIDRDLRLADSRFNYKDAWKAGYSIGEKIDGKFGALGEFANQLTGVGGFDFSQFGTSNNPLHVTSDSKLKVDMSDEDLKYLRDIAERDYVNKFSTATLAPNINIKFGDVRETADTNKVAGRIKKILQEEIAMAAEGSYA